MLRRKCLIAIAAIEIGATLTAQTAPITKPTFEVASVKKRESLFQGFPTATRFAINSDSRPNQFWVQSTC